MYRPTEPLLQVTLQIVYPCHVTCAGERAERIAENSKLDLGILVIAFRESNIPILVDRRNAPAAEKASTEDMGVEDRLLDVLKSFCFVETPERPIVYSNDRQFRDRLRPQVDTVVLEQQVDTVAEFDYDTADDQGRQIQADLRQ